MNSFIPWVGGKGKLLWIINKLMPDRYTRFVDVFGGSGTVTMCRPIQRGCMEVYNDFNGNLTNLFCCVKNRPMALLAELGFLPLNTRDDFNVLYKFFSKGEFTDDYLQEEMDLTEVYLKPPTPRPSAPSCWSVRPAGASAARRTSSSSSATASAAAPSPSAASPATSAVSFT